MKIKKIVFTGPESGGKTSLATLCSEKFKLPYLEELARNNPDVIARRITTNTIISLANQTQKQETEALKLHSQIICDTSLLVLYVWLKVKFNIQSSELQLLITKTKQETYYLLCKPDIPWEYDVLREDPYARDKLFTEYLQLCEHWNLNYTIIQGTIPERTNLTFQQFEVLTTLR